MPNRQIIPNLIVAGVTKAGTTSLFRYLSGHPQVCSSSIKETCHFLPLRYNERPLPFSDYSRYFSHCAHERLIIESTPGYFNGGAAVAREINTHLPNVKIVVLFRDPVTRFFSHFHYMKSLQKLDRGVTITEYLSDCEKLTKEALAVRANDPWFGLEGGKYADYLDPWIETFGQRIRITFFENLMEDPNRYLQDLSVFADIDSNYFKHMEFRQENKTRDHKNAWMHAFALRAYGTFAPILNRHPGLKLGISSVYAKLNERPTQVDIAESQHISDRLTKYYAPSNAALRAQLITLPTQMVSDSFPKWLTETSLV
ncbi:MAG: sulfotransferase domain-containing protein [Halieaceae bacterium]|uniref:sulfotransferase family protein n=1 Tax=Haliea alexandrii TaxID=2448162 RepID=UPI001304A2CA|nr:sulfotransferase domain-containing protein [Haliea alexandrii]MCR9185095.1 sulfotransferase domain-containing protein [Halieaceae bacterium]